MIFKNVATLRLLKVEHGENCCSDVQISCFQRWVARSLSGGGVSCIRVRYKRESVFAGDGCACPGLERGNLAEPVTEYLEPFS